MTPNDVIDVASDALLTLLATATPVMLTGLFVGVLIALFQALTQLQEMTLTFVPKIIVIMLVLIYLMPYMGTQLGDLMFRVTERIGALGG